MTVSHSIVTLTLGDKGIIEFLNIHLNFHCVIQGQISN